MQIKHDLKQASYFQTRCTATDKMQVGGHAHLTYRKFYTHVHHIDFEKCDINFVYTSFGKFWVSCMLQFNMFFMDCRVKNLYVFITSVKNFFFYIKMVPRFACVFLTCEELVHILQTFCQEVLN